MQDWSTDLNSNQETATAPVIKAGDVTRTYLEGDFFQERVLDVARAAHYGKFIVFLNGRKVTPDNAPATLSNGDVVEIIPEDRAGNL